MFDTPPTKYDISGQDQAGNDAYELHAVVTYNKKHTQLTRLKATIYQEDFEVPADLLAALIDPHFDMIQVTNDSGIFGSYFYVRLPFGDAVRCHSGQKRQGAKVLVISNIGKMNNKGIDAWVTNTCG